MKQDNMSDVTIQQVLEENELLKQQVALLMANQEKIKSSVQNFLEKADEVQEVARKTFSQNILRLKVYELKLISYYNKLVQKYPIDHDLSSLSDFIAELKTVINKDFFSREDFELFGASRELGKVPLTGVEMLMPSESGFDFFEAMHPEKDLAELCKELGLMTEEE